MKEKKAENEEIDIIPCARTRTIGLGVRVPNVGVTHGFLGGRDLKNPK
jgi:hypothetical protein